MAGTKITPSMLREIIGTQMVSFSSKLVEWAGPVESNQVADFNTLICTLRDSNLKVLCTIVGKCFGDVTERIKSKDFTLWTDEAYLTKISRALMSSSDKKIDLTVIFKTFNDSNEGINEAIKNEFWTRLATICGIYQKLIAVDDAIYEDVYGGPRRGHAVPANAGGATTST